MTSNDIYKMECLKSLLENHQMGNVQIHTYAINVIMRVRAYTFNEIIKKIFLVH